MLFFHPMWDHDAERIGKQKCTPLGYTLQVTSDLIGGAGFYLLLGLGAYIGYRGFTGTFDPGLLWLCPIPLGLGIIASILFHISWSLAHRKNFRYNSETCEASWEENGERRFYGYQGESPTVSS